MQTTGHVYINQEKVLVLVRSIRYGRALKLRVTGKDAQRFEDEEAYLNEHPEQAQALLSGRVVYL